jgi:dihydroorotase
VGFTDAKTPVANSEIMRRALEYTRMFDKPIFNHPQVPELDADGVMHEGYHSMLLGLRGMPAAAEDVMVGRDLALTELTGGRLHLMCISTKRSVRQIAHAKADGLRVTCEVTPHQLALTDECLRLFDANYKVDPPLRTEDHIEALIAGLKDGTIDAICSDHQPYAEEKKAVELDAAPFGIIGLETLLPICIKTLIEPGRLTWPELIAKLTTGPARILGINKGTLKLGADGDVTIIDPNTEWTIDAARFQSQSRNTPFDGWKVKGRAHTVIVRGQIRYQAD